MSECVIERERSVTHKYDGKHWSSKCPYRMIPISTSKPATEIQYDNTELLRYCLYGDGPLFYSQLQLSIFVLHSILVKHSGQPNHHKDNGRHYKREREKIEHIFYISCCTYTIPRGGRTTISLRVWRTLPTA